MSSHSHKLELFAGFIGKERVTKWRTCFDDACFYASEFAEIKGRRVTLYKVLVDVDNLPLVDTGVDFKD